MDVELCVAFNGLEVSRHIIQSLLECFFSDNQVRLWSVLKWELECVCSVFLSLNFDFFVHVFVCWMCVLFD